MSSDYPPRPIRTRTFKEIYGANQGMRRFRFERPYSPNRRGGGNFESTMRKIAEARRRLQERHPREQLPTREEVTELCQENKLQDREKKMPTIEIGDKKYEVIKYDSYLRAVNGYDIIPFDHLETKEDREKRKDREKREKVERKNGERLERSELR